MHEQELHLVLSNPPPDTLPGAEAKRQGAKPHPFAFVTLVSAADPPAGVKALRLLEHLRAPPQRIKTGLDHGLSGESTVVKKRIQWRPSYVRVQQTHPSRYVVILKSDVFDRIPLHRGSHWI